MECKFEYKCDFCEKSFFNEEILGLHIKSIHKSIIEGWKKCNYCDKTLSKNSLYLHVKMTHENKKHHECETCDKKFVKKCHLDRHKKVVHQKIKSLKCISCEKEFASKRSLVMHISVIHENKKDFKCKRNFH